MPLEIVTIPCLSDNYAFLVHNAQSGETALVDAPEAAPILKDLSQRGWKLSHILLTHHHGDHIDAVPEILEAHPARVIGAAADAHRLPPLDDKVRDGDNLTICGEQCDVLDVSGHTVGHVAFHFPLSKAVFTADSLMALGCGRLFEGTAPQMWASLSKLAALPDDTLVCSGHEYTQANGQFAETIDPNNPALKTRIAEIADDRAAGRPTVPSLLSLEKATNPFLRANDANIRRNLGLEQAAAAEVFAEIRGRKDRF
ncbi:hydroxyacylglutathione hydrolase [Primorskyibacter sp. S87]|uniref:hydroxyacylglutathione hydrolase n=1 Tax=Primorskyibacter sp. S87 TaxID=3415126 RepID=UPI003C7CA990